MILKLDPHIHSCYSPDTNNKIEDILKKSIDNNLDIIAISDHDTIEGSKKAIQISKDLLVIPSIEISSKSGHILGFGVNELIPKGLNAEETIDLIHDAGGIAIIPHPYCFYRHGLIDKLGYCPDNVDAIETRNARFIIGYCNHKSIKLSQEKNLPGLGSSDAHFVDFIGDCYTEINCEKDVDSVLKAIKKGNVKALGKGTSNISLSKYLFEKNILNKY